MQRGKACGRLIRVGAFFEQELHQLRETRVSRQGRRADAPGILIVHVCARCYQQFRRREIAGARREHQGRVTSVRDRPVVGKMTMRRYSHHLCPNVGTGVDIRAASEQDLHDIGMLLRRCPHEGRLTARAARVHIRALSG